ncbi:TonB-dependent receptor plug domain-containing protein [Pseudidiomarina terrestris]|uniref:TonB-dependent receptor n=1 Tax=Pseudidiomarina terrestris TaxID=2820060 RepID=A0AAW7R237_9GAMM|nr:MULTISPECIES: TonB-dependent receptor [unclassified Pseudidiomarina]MDN7124594.1 TonB-dependent receptor [Pseudidiomarina sp. 1APP75-32.1]MDN7129115.1 TonB-dependent receptor [Pseudidiomarina sp. 1APR75-15]MDN7134621.1 TonB-dependent receptor [Pseudidiomarina sp. 1ASP75-5]
MMQKSFVARSVQAALTLAVLATTPAIAQDISNDEQGEPAPERIQVTGSRIPQSTNVVSSSPVSQVTAEEFEFSGAVRTEDLVNDLPQVFPGQASTDTNGATGTATVSLRGLGSYRTLALINGRRMVMGSPAQSGIAADLNQIPAALIKNVELLTGGASATYGSDAVAGVVNFIMDDEFEGVKFSYQNSFYQHNNNNNGPAAQANKASGFALPDSSVTDGHMNDYSLIMGANSADGKGNVTVYATYRDIQGITQDQRENSACALAGSPDNWRCSGSATIPDGLWLAGNNAWVHDGADFINYDGRVYNYAPLNYFQRPDTRTTLGGFAKYYVNEHAEFFAEVGYMKDHSLAQIAQSGSFFLDVNFNCSNPLLSEAHYQAMCADRGYGPDDSFSATFAKRNVEGGPRYADLQHISHRLVAGVRGEITRDWTYDLSFNAGDVAYSEMYQNDLSNTAIKRALDIVADPATGEAVCRSALEGLDPSCVPWNVFQPNGITDEQLAYLTLPLYANGETQLREFNVYTVGDLSMSELKSPWAYMGPSILFGYTHRSEALRYQPDSAFQSGDGAGQGGPSVPVNGDLSVDEIYTEIQIPLVTEASFADTMMLDLGYRYSDYSTGIDTDTYKVALGWDVTDTFKIRSSFQSAVRHANIRELFQPQGLNLFDMAEDPCAGANPTASLEACANTGVTAEQYGSIFDNPAGQYNYMQGGNPNLDAEKSETKAIGFVWRPHLANDFDISVDYFDIDVEDAVGIVDPIFSLNQCLETGDATYCDLINRNENGSIWQGAEGYITATNVNIGYLRRTGVDINSNYLVRLSDMGRLKFNLVGTYFMNFDELPQPGSDLIQCAGLWGGSCGGPNPEWQHNLRSTWVTPWDMTLSMNWRYLGGVDHINSDFNLGAENYIDLTAQFSVLSGGQINVGVNNVFDNDAPLVPNQLGDNGNTFPSFYDALGRYFFAGFEYKF